MNKKLKHIRQTISMLLVIAMVLLLWPMSVYAEIGNRLSLSSYDGITSEDIENLRIQKDVFELVDRREEYVKHFRMEDGTVTAVQYDVPVHYLDENGKWQDIDNTLSLSGSEYSTNNAKIKFVKKITGNESLFTLHNGNQKITMSLNGAKKKVAGKVINTKTEFGAEDTKLQKLMTLDKLSSRIIYEDILDGVDLEYVVDSLNVKENIIVKEKSNTYSYDFTIKLNNLEIASNDDGSIRIYNPENDETVYNIPKGYMYDANGEMSYAVDYKIINIGNSKYIFKVTADEEWINADDRAFPVTIDPPLGILTTSAVDTYVSSSAATSSYGKATDLYVGSNYYSYWKPTAFPSIPSSALIVEATISLKAITGSGLYIGAYEATSAWNENLTWNTANASSLTNLLDHHLIMSTQRYYDWDITEIVKKWHSSNASVSNFYGVCFKPAVSGSGYVIFGSSENSGVSSRPKFCVRYTDTKGLESYWTYVSQDAGIAGTGHVNYATGNLTLVNSTISTTDSLMQYVPTLVYNSSLAGKEYKYIDGSIYTALTSSYMPYGFKLNINETIIKKDYTNVEKDSAGTVVTTGVSYEYYILADADGTEHYFHKYSDTQYIDEDGLLLVLHDISASSCSITDENNTVRKYVKTASNPSGTLGAWVLSEITDKNGNKISFTLDSSSRPTEIKLTPKGSSAILMLTISYNSSGKPYVIWNRTTNEAVVFRYSSGYSSYIASGTGNYLRQVVYAHGSSSVTEANWQNCSNIASSTTNITVDGIAYYEYDVSGRMISAKDGLSKYEVKYTYSGNKVTAIQEYGNGTAGQKIEFDYSKNEIRSSGKDDIYGNTDDIITHYVADNKGRIISAYTTDTGRTQIYGANNGIYETDNAKAVNSIKISSTISGSSANYLLSGKSEYWYTTGSVSFSTSTKFSTNDSVRFNISANATDAIYQYVYLKPGTYTLSCDIDSVFQDDVKVWLKAESVSSPSRIFSQQIALNMGMQSGSGSFETLTFTANNVSNSGEVFKISISAVCGSSASNMTKMSLKNIMLAKRTGAQDVNLVNNGDFEQTSVTSSGASRYATTTLWKSVINDKTSGSADIYNESGIFGKVLRITGDISKSKSIEQVIYSSTSGITGTRPQVFTVSGFGKTNKETYSSSGTFGISVEYKYYENSTLKTAVETFKFSRGISDWQFLSGTVVIPKGRNVREIKVCCVYFNNGGTAYFDDICLTYDPGEKAVMYQYDSNGRVIKSESGDNVSFYKYAANGDLLGKISNGTECRYTYNSTHDLTKEIVYKYITDITPYSNYDAAKSAINASNKQTYQTVYTRNTYGLVTKIEVTGTDKSTQQYTYNVSSGSRIFGSLATETDSLGNITRYFYDLNNGRLLAVIQPDGNGTCYTYDSVGRLDLVQPAKYSTSWSTVSNSAKVDYNYNSLNQLETIKTNGTTYTFGYDSFGNTSSVKIGSTVISSTTRNANNGKVNKVTYGNGVTASYTYDLLDRVSGIVYNNGSSKQAEYKYEYNADGRLYKFIDVLNKKQTVYRYGKDGSLTGFVESDTSSYENQYSAGYVYDDYSRLSNINYYFGGSSAALKYTYTYNTDGTVSKVSANIPAGCTYDISFTYDNMLRFKTKDIEIKSSSGTASKITSSYQYKTASSSTSTLISRYGQGITKGSSSAPISDFSYTYDKNGNITLISNSEGTKDSYRYEYDSLGRLTREDNSAAGKSYKYEYDNDGNIKTKKTYAYTTGTLGAVQSTNTYTYGNANWKDQLTSFNGYSITYDAIGNPLSYYNGTRMTFTWEQGRKLAKVVKNSVTTTYKYNDEVRLSKTVGGVTHSYRYDGNLILSESYTGTTLLFVYDENGSPIGFKYNNDYYVYAKNLQGDIVEIYDNAGNVVTKYVYDAWGNIISITGSRASTVGVANPFRYRGYYWDSETGFYWLYTRYYDPAIGRFINADSYLFENIQGFNIYAYCYNNPVNMIDTIGMMPKFTQEFIDGFNEWVSTPLGILRYLKEYSPKGELYEYWIDSNNVIRWGRHHTTHSNPKHHQNPHDHQWIVDDNGNNKPNGGQSPNNGFKAPNSNLKKGDDSNRNDISNIVGGAVATAAVGYVIYVGVKWIIAIAAAPATGGGSIIIAGVTP